MMILHKNRTRHTLHRMRTKNARSIHKIYGKTVRLTLIVSAWMIGYYSVHAHQERDSLHYTQPAAVLSSAAPGNTHALSVLLKHMIGIWYFCRKSQLTNIFTKQCAAAVPVQTGSRTISVEDDPLYISCREYLAQRADHATPSAHEIFRRNALDHIAQHGFCLEQCDYAFAPELYSVVSLYGYRDKLRVCSSGNQLHNQLYQEGIMLLHELVRLHMKAGKGIVLTFLFDLTFSALDCAHEGDIVWGWHALDFCWMVVSYVKECGVHILDSSFLLHCKLLLFFMLDLLEQQDLCAALENYNNPEREAAQLCAAQLAQLFMHSGVLEYLYCLTEENPPTIAQWVTLRCKNAMPSITTQHASKLLMYLLEHSQNHD
jgi:hypothetical protein